MNKYENYKEVNLTWIKKIPSHWNIEKINALFSERKEKNLGSHEKFILSVMKDKGVIPYTEKGNVGNKASEKIENYKLVYPDDIVLNCMNMMIGSLGKSDYKGVLSQVYYVLKLINSKCDIDYLSYSFKNKIFYESLRVLGKGILDHRLRVPMETLKYELLPIPNYSEQRQIVNYLDWKIKEIDSLIQIEKKKIKELEMYKLKELNNIYKNIVTYKEVPLKRVGKIFPGKEIEEETKEGIPVYGSGKSTFKYTTKSLLDGEYIIFGRKGTIGKPYKLSGKFWIVDTAYAIKNNDLVLLDYLYYLLRIFNWKDFLTNTVKPSIVANQILQVKMRIPSIEIQEKIVKNIYLLEEKIENTIKLSNKKISLLIELKNSLISEVVTGQIDVRNVKIPKRE